MRIAVGSALHQLALLPNHLTKRAGPVQFLDRHVMFVLDNEGNMDAILHNIRGLGGTVLRTNVDAERAKLVQSTLVASADAGAENSQTHPESR